MRERKRKGENAVFSRELSQRAYSSRTAEIWRNVERRQTGGVNEE